MTVISRISRLRHPGVLHDFTWPKDLPTFVRYNLIYGWNGSGKTTISNLFRALEERKAPTNAKVTLSINGAEIQGNEFGEAKIPVRVFNRDYVRGSVFPIGGGDVPPILVLGKEGVEKQQDIEELKKDLSDAQDTLASAKYMKDEAEKKLDRHCINSATVIKNTLRSSDTSKYNNYDKSNYKDRALKMAKFEDADIQKVNESDHEKLFAQHKGTPKPKIQIVSYQAPDLAAEIAKIEKLLQETVVSATIKSLRDDHELSSWVHQGLGLHQSRNEERCLFCEQMLPKERMDALAAHYNDEYNHFSQRLDSQLSAIQLVLLAATKLSLPNRAQFYEDLTEEYDEAESAHNKALEITKNTLDALTHSLTSKKVRAFEAYNLDVIAPNVDISAVERVNNVVQKHNNACDEFSSRVDKARKQLEADTVADSIADFNQLVADVKERVEAFRQIKESIKKIGGEIALLESEIMEHQKPAEELNDDLHKYLGHAELQLDVKDTGYTVSRNGVMANELSEGETTAIALLYFLKSLQDQRFELSTGVVVLDDPVSSLDANALYLAFGFIQQRTQGSAQLFVLTHNFTFFRQVRNWFHHLKGQNKSKVDKRPAHFYMLDFLLDAPKRSSTITSLDPLLEKYESEYHYLFACVFREANNSAHYTLEQNYAFPNMARRLLEAFLAFRQPQVSGGLWQKLKNVSFDEAKKVRILRFLHTHSHGDTIGEPEHDPSLLGEARSVLSDLLQLIKQEDTDHFKAMSTLITSPSENGDDE